MKIFSKTGLLLFASIMVCGLVFGQNLGPLASPPRVGFGSSDHYITQKIITKTFGNIHDGTKTYTFIPGKLKNGTWAPVVIQLHGAMLIGPEIYWETISHIVKQGYIVIHPQFNKALPALLFEFDQNKMLARAIATVKIAISKLGKSCKKDQIYLYGHSLGGLMGMCWEGAGGPPLAGRILAHPNIDPNAACDNPMQPKIIVLDYLKLAEKVKGPVTILGGDKDNISPLADLTKAWYALKNAKPKKIFYFQNDPENRLFIDTDHMAPTCDTGFLPEAVAKGIGGKGKVNALDWYFYNAAIDAMLQKGTVDLSWSIKTRSGKATKFGPVDKTPK